MKSPRWLVVFTFLTLSTACSSGGASERDAGAVPDASRADDAAALPDGSSAPLSVSIQTSSDQAQVGQALVFEGVSAPAPAGIILSWDFGDGVRGGGDKIAHAFASAGSFEVTLFALDGEGKRASARQQVNVSSQGVAGPGVSAKVVVSDLLGVPIAGAKLRVDDLTIGGTDAAGKVTVLLTSDVHHVLSVSKPGYAEQVRRLTVLSTSLAGESDLAITLLARAAAQSLDASAGGVVAGPDGESLTVAPRSLINTRGEVVTGSIDVRLTSVDVTDDKAVRGFPGDFAGFQNDGKATGIVSHGTTEFVIEQAGERLNLAPGVSASIRIPVFAGANLDGSEVFAGASIPLWSLDERLGTWVQEGTGTVIDVGGGSLVLEAKVAHFSWWNADMPFIAARPRPKCVLLGADVPGANDYLANASICKMLVDIDRGIPEQKATKNRKLPAYSALDDVPINGGKGVSVPASVGLVLRGCILSGLFCGETAVSLGVGAEQEVEIRLLPTDDVVTPPVGEGTLITAPYDQDFPFDQVSKSDVYRFQAAQGGVTQVMLTRSAVVGAGKLTTGTLRLFRGSELIAVSAFDGQGNAGEVPGQVTIVAKTAGEYTLEVAWSERPFLSKYRLRLIPLTVENRTLPFDAETIPQAPDGFVAYAFEAEAMAALRVLGWFTLYGQAAGTKSSLKLLHSDGKPLATSPPAGPDDQFHFGATPAATERLLLVAYYQNASPPTSRVSLSVSSAQALVASPAPATQGAIPTYASRAYRFTGMQAEVVTLTLTRGYPYSQMDLRLYGPDGQRIVPAAPGSTTYAIETSLPSAGEYVVEVIRGQPINGDTGAYTLTLATAP